MDNEKRSGRALRASAPLTWAVLTTLILNLVMEICRRTCFPLYGPHALYGRTTPISTATSAPTFIEKIDCRHCGRLIGYAHAIAGRTAQHWCGITRQV